MKLEIDEPEVLNILIFGLLMLIACGIFASCREVESTRKFRIMHGETNSHYWHQHTRD